MDKLRVQPEVRGTANEELSKGSPTQVSTQQKHQTDDMGVNRLLEIISLADIIEAVHDTRHLQPGV